jgi:hypothetical protein
VLVDVLAGRVYSQVIEAREVRDQLLIVLSGSICVDACISAESQIEAGGQMPPRPAMVAVQAFAM